MKFRKKPVVIEAFQYKDRNDFDVMRWVERVDKRGGIQWHFAPEGITIPTLEGDHLASDGDWIIQGVKGEFYPCKPDIFDATYEPADLAGKGGAK